MDITIDSGVAAIISAALASIISIAVNLISNRHALKQQNDQWVREERRAWAAAEEAERDRALAAESALKNRLLEIYSNSISTLSKLSHIAANQSVGSTETVNTIEEAEKWLWYVIVYHYDRKSSEYEAFRDLCLVSRGQLDSRNAHELRKMLIQFISEDPRLQ